MTTDTMTDREKVEALLDEMFGCIEKLIHYYKGMLLQLTTGTYSLESAKSDYQTLLHGEGYDLLSVIDDYIDKVEPWESDDDDDEVSDTDYTVIQGVWIR
jgi:hypothetical protein